MSPSFIQGLKLSQIFFEDALKPLLEKYYPLLQYDASLIGPGSEVLGFDDHISSDHHWGPRLQLFLSETDYHSLHQKIDLLLRQKLPYSIQGYSTHWSKPDPNDNMNQFLEPTSEGLVNHRVDIFTVNSYLRKVLCIDSTNLTDIDWLILPEQRLLELTAGKIFHQSLGELPKVRKYFSYYPENVWYFKILSEWDHISEEMAFVGRSAPKGDDLGSRLVATRLVRYIIRLAFILCKTYVPYSKWFGFAFSFLPIATDLQPILLEILTQDNWRKRENLLTEAYLVLLDYQNSLQITPKISVNATQFFSRDQMIINTQKIKNELRKLIIPPLDGVRYPIGSVDQFIVDTHILTDAQILQATRGLYSKTM